jgi:hypothetical protein
LSIQTPFVIFHGLQVFKGCKHKKGKYLEVIHIHNHHNEKFAIEGIKPLKKFVIASPQSVYFKILIFGGRVHFTETLKFHAGR